MWALTGPEGSVLLARQHRVTQRKAEDRRASGSGTRGKGEATDDGDRKGDRRTGGGVDGEAAHPNRWAGASEFKARTTAVTDATSKASSPG